MDFIDNVKQFDDNVNDKNQLISSNSVCESPSKSRYGRMIKPKIVKDFYNFNHIDDNDDDNNGNNDKLNNFNDNNDLMIDNLDTKVNTKNKINNTIIVDKGKEVEELKDDDMTKIIKLITKPSIITTTTHDNLKKSNKIGGNLKTYTNKRKYIYDNQNNCKVIESFGLPDEPIVPITNSTNSNIDDFQLNIADQLPDLWHDDDDDDDQKTKSCCSKTNYYRQKEHDENQTRLEETTTLKFATIQENIDESIKKCDNLENQLGGYHHNSIDDCKIGDLVWAKLGSHPYWPCLISENAEFKTYKRPLYRLKKIFYYVRFFADNGRGAWINPKDLLYYNGKDDDLIKLHPIKSNNKLKLWQKACEEAESLLDKTIEERLKFFQEILQQKTINNRRNSSSSSLINSTYKKRKRRNDSITNKLKSIKTNSINSSTIVEKVEKIENYEKRKSIPTTLEEQEILYRRNHLFRGISKEKVCQICEKSGNNVQRCKGPCNGVFHENCLLIRENNLSLSKKIDLKMKEILRNSNNNNNNDTVIIIEEFRCNYCRLNQPPPCFVCKRINNNNNDDNILPQKCSLYNCGQFYHLNCLKLWQQTQWTSIYSKIDTFVCPQHICHTCCSEDPHLANSRCSNGQIVKCLKCPATYHTTNYCVPAGTIILSTTQIICPRHFNNNSNNNNNNNNNGDNNNNNSNRRFDKFNQTINAHWCFICSKGGDLICCETCPTSVHIECLPPNNSNNNNNNNDTFFCEDCQSGRLPLYDEVVWVKLGACRWWPAIILFPNEIPEKLHYIKHKNGGDFVVKFFGTYDHHWVGRGRTFLFHEDDNQGYIKIKNRIDNVFKRAVDEALKAHKLKKQFRLNILMERNFLLKPPHYIRLKVNKPVGNVRLFDGGNTSNTTSCDCDPNQQFPCGPDSNCLNRLLLTECNPDTCPAGDRCCNQCFEKRQYPPLLPYKTQSRGWGLKTLSPIRHGQFIIEYVGEMIDEQEYKRRIRKMHEQKVENYYFLTIDNYRILDAGPKGNVARFMNHSCQPNCETQKWTVNGDTRVGLFATCDIPAGTELTFNYNLECIGEEKKECKCGATNCSGFIGVKAIKNEEITNEANKVQRKKRRGRKRKKLLVVKTEDDTENLCFICRQNGDVYRCCNKICTKFYHLKCVGLETWPTGGKWLCSWHNCNICTKRTIRCCFDCLNSYCPTHSDGNIRYDKFLGFVCKQHDPLVNNHYCKDTKILSTTNIKDDKDCCLSLVKNNCKESMDLAKKSNNNNNNKKKKQKKKTQKRRKTRR